MGIRFGAPLGALLVIAAIAPAAAGAATFNVNTTADTTVAGGCTTDPACSLRDAVAAANASADALNTINVPAGTYDLTAGQLSIAPVMATTTIVDGAGARDTTIDAGRTSRVFGINSGTATISDLTITGGNGDTGAGPEPGDGGGIIVSGLAGLTLTDSTVTDNEAAFAGAGIAAPSFHSLGGVIAPSVTIERSTISDNNLTGGSVPVAAIGAGIGTYGSLTITNSTITGNTTDSIAAVNLGGGIAAGADPTAVTPSDVSIVNSTIAGNSVTGLPLSTGGGLATPTGSPTTSLEVTNTIIQGNTVNGSEGDCAGLIAPTSANNLTGDASCGFADAGSFQGNPQLGSLADNGGPTNTLLPVEGSPAIDAGTDTGCPATDQRGVTRPQRTRCDIGAVEVAPLPPPPPPASPAADLAVALTAKPASPKLGRKVTFTMAVTNAGPSAATSAVLTGKLPAPGSQVIPPEDCTIKKFKKAPVPKRKLSCALGTLETGASATRKVKIKPGERTRMPRATAQATSPVPDPAPANNVAKLRLDVSG